MKLCWITGTSKAIFPNDAVNPSKGNWVAIRVTSLDNVFHTTPLEIGSNQVHRELPTGIIQSFESDTVGMLPVSVTMRAIPGNEATKIDKQ